MKLKKSKKILKKIKK